MAELAQRDPAAANQLLQQAQVMAAQVAQQRAAAAASQVPVVQPTEDSIAQIVAMGFSEERARGALLQTQNNVEAAVGRLIG